MSLSRSAIFFLPSQLRTAGNEKSSKKKKRGKDTEFGVARCVALSSKRGMLFSFSALLAAQSLRHALHF